MRNISFVGGEARLSTHRSGFFFVFFLNLAKKGKMRGKNGVATACKAVFFFPYFLHLFLISY